MEHAYVLNIYSISYANGVYIAHNGTEPNAANRVLFLHHLRWLRCRPKNNSPISGVNPLTDFMIAIFLVIGGFTD